MLLEIEEEVNERFLDAVPELFASALTKILFRPNDEITRLVLVYQVMLAKYVRLKILLNRQRSRYDRWTGVQETVPAPPQVTKFWFQELGFQLHDIGRRGITEREPNYETLYLAMSAAQDDKNRVQEQLKSLGLSDATLRLIRQGKWV